MDELLSSWGLWALLFAVGLPVIIVTLTEVLGVLQRSGHPAQKPVRFLRNWVLPVAGLLALLAFAVQQPGEHVWVRVVATVLGFLVILLLLSTFNVALFSNAEPGTWRHRIPSIFIDIARLLLIVVGLAILFSWVWGADVGGLFTALGVTSIVVGLALQNAVGGVVSGLLLLFEQPFTIGDWLDTGTVRGRVIEVNWRAVHIDTGSGTQIVPNAALATASFKNLSVPSGSFTASLAVTFSTDDPPDEVLALLREVAAALPELAEGKSASVAYVGKSEFSVTLPIPSPSRQGEIVGLYRQRLWYASRRRGFALDGDRTDPIREDGVLEAAVARLAPVFALGAEAATLLAETARLERFGAGETVQEPGRVPSQMRVVIEGALKLWAPVGDAQIELEAIEFGGFVGQTVLTREAAFLGARALGVVTVLTIPLESLHALVRSRPELAKRIGDSIEHSRQSAREAQQTVTVGPAPRTRPATEQRTIGRLRRGERSRG